MLCGSGAESSHRFLLQVAPACPGGGGGEPFNEAATNSDHSSYVYTENPEAFDGQGSIIMLELADETGARRVALRMAGAPWERAARGRRRAL